MWNHTKSISKLEKVFKADYNYNMQGLVKRTGTRTTSIKKYIFLLKEFLHQVHLISGEKQKEQWYENVEIYCSWTCSSLDTVLKVWIHLSFY